MQYIHELQPEVIQEILAKGAWQTLQQSLTSAQTNSNSSTEPDPILSASGENTAGIDAFNDINFGKDTTKLIDVGGGKYNTNQVFMARKGIEVIIWDPYNRSKEHNATAQQEVSKQKVMAATSMSVLNVIPEVTVRLAHIATLKDTLQIKGKAYFKIWPGEGKLRGSFFSSSDGDVFQANAHALRFFREIQVVFGLKNVTVDLKIPNLIVAVNNSRRPLSVAQIVRIQELSRKDLHLYQHFQKTFYERESRLNKMEYTFFRQSYMSGLASKVREKQEKTSLVPCKK